MNTIIIDRAVVEQALKALEAMQSYAAAERKGLRICDEAIPALRAALAQQKDPTDPGRDVDVLREHVRHLERRVRQLHAQQAEPQGCATEEDCTKQPWCRIRGECQRKQAEPVEPHRWEGDNNIESPFNACMHKTYCMTLKQAEPLNLSDFAVQKRLATQWGYVPAAAQAEPVQEPVYKVKVTSRWHDTEPLVPAFSLPDGEHLLYAAPPQRKPLTEGEIDGLVIQHAGYGRDNFYAVARAIERAHGIKE